MSEQQFSAAIGTTPPEPVTPQTTTATTTAESQAVTPLLPTPLSTLSKEFTALELEVAHHENILYNIQTTLTTLLPVTQQTTLNILSSIENAAEDLWSLKQQYERANVALLRLRLDDIRQKCNSNSNNNGGHDNNDEELDQMKKVADMISKSLRWAEEFRMELGRRTDAVYFAAGDLEGIEVGDGDGELEVVRGGRGGLGVVSVDGAATMGGVVGCLWDDGRSDGTTDSWDADETLWDTGENTANMI